MHEITHITPGNASRQDLIEKLMVYGASHIDEIGTAQRFIDFIQREPGCFLRSTVEGHVTGSAWIMHPTEQLVLLTHHKKLNRWLQLGGHADGDADILRVALTEAVEESGIAGFHVHSESIFDIDIHPIPAMGTIAEHVHYDVRFVLRALSSHHTVTAESHDLAWVDVHGLSAYTSEPSMLRMARKWVSQTSAHQTK